MSKTNALQGSYPTADELSVEMLMDWLYGKLEVDMNAYISGWNYKQRFAFARFLRNNLLG